MKKVLILAAAALALAACVKQGNEPEKVPQTQVEPGVVAFDTYIQRVTTRAGEIADLNNDALQKEWDPAQSKFGGFGVFAYYTDNTDYDQMAEPNFMYNQLVTYSSTYWAYSPLKYWPNEYGDTAISDETDKLTFFAYAPYVEVDPATGKPTENNKGDDTCGITQLTRNTTKGDPIVKYIASFEAAKAVDLCWGVNEQNTWTTVVEGTKQEFTKGMPWIDVQRPAQAATQANATNASRIKFTFKHALAKMQVNIDAFVDGYDNTNERDANTRIWIRSVRFNGFAMKGALNLNNEEAYTPYWLNYNGVGELEATGDVVVYDGRRDGKEGMANAEASNEKSLGLNTEFIQVEDLVESDAWTPSTPLGVTKTQQPLFNGGGIFYVIPLPDEDVQVEIVYDVETIDKNLNNTISDCKTKGSSVENHITKTISFGSTRNLEAGKAYTINLHLGMNSVKFDAEVVGWDDMVPTDVDLPANMPVYTASTTASTKQDISIPGYNGDGATYDYVFAVDGFVGGEAVAATAGTILTGPTVYSTGAKLVAGTDDNVANASGVAYIKAAVEPYYGVEDSIPADDISFLSTSGANLTLTVKQLAVKLGLKAPSTLTAGSDYTLERSVTGATWANANCPTLGAYTTPAGNNYIRVWRNGAELTFNASTPATNEFSFDNGTGKITLGQSAVAGDEIKVTIKAGDVAEETITFTVG